MNYYIVLSVIAAQDATNESYIFPQTVWDVKHIVHTFGKKKKEEIIKIRSCESFEVLGAQWQVPLLTSGFS